MVTVCAFTAACAANSSASQEDLLVYADYPTTLNAVAMDGELQYSKKCLSLMASDGARYVPLVRSGTNLGDLERSLGDLGSPKRVTISAYNVVDALPEYLAREISDRNCEGTPIVFGSIRPGSPKLQVPDDPARTSQNNREAL